MCLRAEAFHRGRQPWERETTRHRQDGCSSVHLMLFYDDTSFANGVPALRFVVKSKKWTR
jgi:ectoine hydroxylase-related dioxygenase (phytanoyl-CoA dioxygenase family)